MTNNIIDVTIIVFPDGTCHWFKNKPVYKNNDNPNEKYLNDCLAEWRSENEEFIENNPGTNTAVCQIRMPESKYNSIVSDDRFMNSMDRGKTKIY